MAQDTSAQIASDALWDAIRNDDVTQVVAQIKAGVSANTLTDTETPLTYAITFGSVEMVTVLLDHGANPNLTQPISEFSPLMIAAKHNRAEEVDLLLAHQANVNVTGIFGRGPLHLAALYDSLAVGKILLEKTNVDVNARGKMCPLAIASRQGYLDFVSLILTESKAVPSLKCLASAKDMAGLNNNTEVLKLLNSI